MEANTNTTPENTNITPEVTPESEKARIVKEVVEAGTTAEIAEHVYDLLKEKTAEAMAEYIAVNGEDLLKKFPPKEEAEKDPNAMEEEQLKIPDWRAPLNKGFLTQLEEMGFSKNVREKALVMTGNASLENAINWIGENSETPDFEDELVVMGVKEGPPKKVLTPEEIKIAQKELREKLKKNSLEKERLLEIEQEKFRMNQGKEMAMAKRQMEEQEMKLGVELMQKQRIKDAEDRAKAIAKIEEEKKRRFGDKYVPPAEKKQTPEQMFDNLWDKMRKLYMGKTDVIKTCFTTVLIYLGNIKKDRTNPKFQKINTNNPAFKKRVGDVLGGNVILKNCGFGEPDAEGFFNYDLSTPEADLDGWMKAINLRLAKL